MSKRVAKTMTRSEGAGVLLSWIARNNDPYERQKDGKYRKSPAGDVTPGPTLSLLFDTESSYRGKIDDVVLFYRVPKTGTPQDRDAEKAIAEETKSEILALDARLRVSLRPWAHDDPTDHKGIYEFLEKEVPRVRQEYPGRELIIHVSPGTPSMHTIWVLMVETGLVPPPCALVKSYRREERRGRPPVASVEVGIDTFYKAYRASRPMIATSEEETVQWDPSSFRSEKMRRVFADARRFAQLKVPILILGERGTGKTTLASWIRISSPFRQKAKDKAWPAISCGQYSPELMRAELFGYSKGAYTGAEKAREGVLVGADKDTLFLDEIGDISHEVQRLLIRAIEEHQFTPLGETAPIKSDFRLITATNRPLESLRERLDADFLDRISYFVLHLPPLREIPEELPWLWERVFTEATRRSGAEGTLMTLRSNDHDGVVRLLQSHPLPGNTRDLFRVAYRLIAAASDPTGEATPNEAIEYAVAEIAVASAPSSASDITRAVLGAYSRGEPLDAALLPGKPLLLRQVQYDLKRYLALEIRRVAKSRGESVGALCDFTERALQKWVQEK